MCMHVRLCVHLYVCECMVCAHMHVCVSLTRLHFLIRFSFSFIYYLIFSHGQIWQLADTTFIFSTQKKKAREIPGEPEIHVFRFV